MDFRKLPAVIAALLCAGPGRRDGPEARQGREEVARRRAADHPRRRGEDVPRAQGQGRPRGVPEDLLGAAGPEPGDAAERVPGRRTCGARRRRTPSSSVAGTRGSETDCGRVFILLGKPDEMKSEPVGETAMLRTPETWTYRDRPGQTFAGGEAKISFSGNCELPQGNRFGDALNQVAASKIRNTNLGYKQGAERQARHASTTRSRSPRRRRRSSRRRARTSRSWSSGRCSCGPRAATPTWRSPSRRPRTR